MIIVGTLNNRQKGYFFLDVKDVTLIIYISSQWARKFKKVQAKKLVKSNKSFFCEIVFFGSFPNSKIDFWPFLKLQKMEFGQKNYS